MDKRRREVPIAGDNSRRQYSSARRTRFEPKRWGQRAKFADILCASAPDYNDRDGGGATVRVGASRTFNPSLIGSLTRAVARELDGNGDAVHAMAALATAVPLCTPNIDPGPSTTRIEYAVSLLLTTLIACAHDIGLTREMILDRIGKGHDEMVARCAAADAEARARIGGVH